MRAIQLRFIVQKTKQNKTVEKLNVKADTRIFSFEKNSGLSNMFDHSTSVRCKGLSALFIAGHHYLKEHN